MAYTEKVHFTDGTTGPFAISFDYLDGASIKVFLSNGGTEEELAFNFAGTPSDTQPSGTSIVLSIAEAPGQTLVIRKVVLLDEPKVVWELGTALTEDNLRTSSFNNMEMAQTAYDKAEKAEVVALTASSTLTTYIAQIESLSEAAQEAQAQAAYWAGIAQDAGSTANPEEAAAIARDAAIAARDAAQLAQSLAEAAQVLAQSAASAASASASSASTSSTLAENFANASRNVQVVPGKYSARHFAEVAQSIVDAGALRWNGSAKFVSTTDPNPTLGVNGDFWFKRET